MLPNLSDVINKQRVEILFKSKSLEQRFIKQYYCVLHIYVVPKKINVITKLRYQTKRAERVIPISRASPTSASSPVYELSVPFFKEGTPEQWLQFRIEGPNRINFLLQ